MNLRLLLLFTAIESFVVILMERGAYFYTLEVLDFSRGRNLLLALGFGVFCALGARVSHRLTPHGTERRMLAMCLAGQATLHGALWISAHEWLLWLCMWGIGLLAGLKWPVVESLVSAGPYCSTTSQSTGCI